MAERAKTTLEQLEDDQYAVLLESNNIYATGDALVHLGITHLAMEPQKTGQALQEIWAGMHSHTGMQNLAIVAQILGIISNAGMPQNPLTLEYADALQRDRKRQDA